MTNNVSNVFTLSFDSSLITDGSSMLNPEHLVPIGKYFHFGGKWNEPDALRLSKYPAHDKTKPPSPKRYASIKKIKTKIKKQYPNAEEGWVAVIASLLQAYYCTGFIGESDARKHYWGTMGNYLHVDFLGEKKIKVRTANHPCHFIAQAIAQKYGPLKHEWSGAIEREHGVTCYGFDGEAIRYQR